MDREIILREWTAVAASGKPGDPLNGLTFDDESIARAARVLSEGNRLHIGEGRHGLSIAARAHVGIVRLGPLRVTVLPKLQPEDLWYVLAYGLGLDMLDRRFPLDVALPEASFVDVLGLMLLREANDLWRRGLRRGYRGRRDWTASPRGRIEVAELAAHMPLTHATLPCSWQELSTETLDNQLVRAGLGRARDMVQAPALRIALRRAEQTWAEKCGTVRLDTSTLSKVERERTRLNASYEPAHRMIALLVRGAGMADDLAKLESGRDQIPGFLWNMATLFERFVARFLQEHASATVQSQVVLRDLFKVIRGPSDVAPPRPRPDLVIARDGRPIAVADTKYRDLVDAGVTRDILYQLSVYGLAYRDEALASLPVLALYPCDDERDDVIVELRPTAGAAIPIIIRGINWSAASRSLRDPSKPNGPGVIADRWIAQ